MQLRLQICGASSCWALESIRHDLLQQRMMGAVIKRFMYFQLSQAWEKWQYTAAVMAEQQRLLEQAMRRFIHRQMLKLKPLNS